MVDELISIREVAEMMKVSRSLVYSLWTTWEKKGLRVMKASPNGHPRFYKSEIVKMLENSYKTK